MKMAKLSRILSFTLCLVLIAAMALFTFGCNDQNMDTGDGENAVPKSFTVVVVDDKGESTSYQITTKKITVGAALFDEGLIEGENSSTGLYVKKVNGLRADWNLDGAYWAFYVGDDYAMTGVDSIEITDGATYKFVYTKS